MAATDLSIARIAVTANLAGAAGALVSVLMAYARSKAWDVEMAMNGALAGLVAITVPQQLAAALED